MLRSLYALCALLFCVGLVLADDVKAKFKSVDTDKNTITFTVDNKDKTLPIDKDALVISDDAKAKAVKGGIGNVKSNADVTITIEKKDDKDTVTVVKVKMGKKKN